MRIERESLRLYAVTDGRWLPGKKKASEELAAVTEELIRAGVTCVQLREKGKSDAELLEEALALKRRYADASEFLLSSTTSRHREKSGSRRGSCGLGGYGN